MPLRLLPPRMCCGPRRGCRCAGHRLQPRRARVSRVPGLWCSLSWRRAVAASSREPRATPFPFRPRDPTRFLPFAGSDMGAGTPALTLQGRQVPSPRRASCRALGRERGVPVPARQYQWVTAGGTAVPQELRTTGPVPTEVTSSDGWGQLVFNQILTLICSPRKKMGYLWCPDPLFPPPQSWVLTREPVLRVMEGLKGAASGWRQ